MRRRLNDLLRDSSGLAVTEFALLVPTLLIMVFGLLDLAHGMYTAQMLQGAVQAAARDATIEGAYVREATIDARVRTAVQAIAPSATLTFSRKSYANFTNVERPEDFNDLNLSGDCDNGEPFEDLNGNGEWDQDIGKQGFGGARDSVLYTVNVRYPRLFPVYAFIPGQNEYQTMIAQSVLRNQPFNSQAGSPSSVVGNCT